MCSFDCMSHSTDYLNETALVAARLGEQGVGIDNCVRELLEVRERWGRLFIIGVGGSAANASHAVNDFRKLCGIQAYAPTDNVSELSARVNDDGWESVFVEWLRVSRCGMDDLVMILSVGGGDKEKNVSVGLVHALDYCHGKRVPVIGIVGRDGGYTAKMAKVCVIVPTVNDARTTFHAESFQEVIWHLFVSHPSLQKKATKWQEVTRNEEVKK